MAPPIQNTLKKPSNIRCCGPSIDPHWCAGSPPHPKYGEKSPAYVNPSPFFIRPIQYSTMLGFTYRRGRPPQQGCAPPPPMENSGPQRWEGGAERGIFSNSPSKIHSEKLAYVDQNLFFISPIQYSTMLGFTYRGAPP